MIYLYYGLESFLIKKEIKSILLKEHIEAINQNTYDLENSTLDDIIEDASTMSLFGDKKAIIVENSYIFTGTTNQKLPTQNIDLLNQYFQNINNNTLLFFIVNKDSIDKRKKIVSELKKVGIIKEFTTLSNQSDYIKTLFEPYQLSSSDLTYFQERVGNDLATIEQEIQKLKSYKADDYKITKQDIMDVTCKNVDTDIFNLIDHIITGNKAKALESYTMMIQLGEEPIKIVIMLANQFRIMYQSKQMFKKGYSEKDISTRLNIHPYRIKLALQKSHNFDEELLLDYLKKLSNLDYEMKSGKIDKNIGLELFILSI